MGRKFWPFSKKILPGEPIPPSVNANVTNIDMTKNPIIDNSIWWIMNEYRKTTNFGNRGSSRRDEEKMIRIWMNSFIPIDFFKPRMNESEILKCVLREVMRFDRDKRPLDKKNDFDKIMYRVERKSHKDFRGWNNVEYIEMNDKISQMTYMPDIKISCKGYSRIIEDCVDSSIKLFFRIYKFW